MRARGLRLILALAGPAVTVEVAGLAVPAPVPAEGAPLTRAMTGLTAVAPGIESAIPTPSQEERDPRSRRQAQTPGLKRVRRLRSGATKMAPPGPPAIVLAERRVGAPSMRREARAGPPSTDGCVLVRTRGTEVMRN